MSITDARWLEFFAWRGPKFLEGWDLHRRGFPRTALVSPDARHGWAMREHLATVYSR